MHINPMSVFTSARSLVKIIFICVIFFILSKYPENLLNAVSGSYKGVGIFVTATLLIVYLFEHYTANSFVNFLIKHQKLQVPIAGMLGVLPGCGGAIIVVTQYSKGYLTFGAMTATLISTMGDAAIILLQKKPAMAFILFAIVWVTAVIVGYGLDYFSKEKRIPKNKQHDAIPATKKHQISHIVADIWFAILLINAVIYFLPDWFNPIFSKSMNYIGLFSCIGMWFFKDADHSCEKPQCNACRDVFGRVVIEASFVISWVFIGMACYEAIATLTKFDFAKFVNVYIYYVPLAAAIIGLIPGCGPQIVLTTLYVSGVIPFSAQVANAISNDGDALMPAIAMQPKKALMATVYSFIPGLIIGYIMLFMGF